MSNLDFLSFRSCKSQCFCFLLIFVSLQQPLNLFALVQGKGNEISLILTSVPYIIKQCSYYCSFRIGGWCTSLRVYFSAQNWVKLLHVDSAKAWDSVTFSRWLRTDLSGWEPFWPPFWLFWEVGLKFGCVHFVTWSIFAFSNILPAFYSH